MQLLGLQSTKLYAINTKKKISDQSKSLTWMEVGLAAARLEDEPVHALQHAVVPRVVAVVQHVALVREPALPLALGNVPHGGGAPYI